MFTKKLIVVSIILGLFSTGLIAKEASGFEKAKTPELTLKHKDMQIIDKAISKNFKGLSSKEKKALIKYLEDYAKSAKHPINPVKPGSINAPKKISSKK